VRPRYWRRGRSEDRPWKRAQGGVGGGGCPGPNPPDRDLLSVSFGSAIRSQCLPEARWADASIDRGRSAGRSHLNSAVRGKHRLKSGNPDARPQPLALDREVDQHDVSS